MLDLIQSDFFIRALIGGLLIGIVGPLMGIFLVLRRLSMIGDTLAHVTIAGVALAFLLGVYPFAMGLGFALIGAIAIEKLRKAYRTYAELSIAIIMSGGVALASLFFTLDTNFNANVNNYLFGSIYTLNNADLAVIGVVTLIVISFLLLFSKEMFMLTFDEDAAVVNGLPVHMLNIVTTVLTAFVISAAIKIVGALLVSALLTIPIAISLLIAKGFKQAIGISVLVAETAVIGGLLTAGICNLAPGATIVLLHIIMLLLTLIAKRGLRV